MSDPYPFWENFSDKNMLLNHSFMMPGLVAVAVSTLVSLGLATLIF